MIITLKGADFGGVNNSGFDANGKPTRIGTLKTYSIRFSGRGVTNSNTSVDRETNSGYTTTITLDSNYELSGPITVSMGGVDITSPQVVNGLTITISTKITGNIMISVPTKNITIGEEEPDTPITPNPNPVLTWYTEQINQPGLTTSVDLSSAPYGYTDTLCANYYSKPVNRIRLKVSQAGNISFGVCSADRKTILSTYTINAIVGTEIYELPETFTVEEGQGVWLAKPDDSGRSYCSITASDKSGTFYSNVGTSSLVAPHDSKYSLGFDLGYFG